MVSYTHTPCEGFIKSFPQFFLLFRQNLLEVDNYEQGPTMFKSTCIVLAAVAGASQAKRNVLFIAVVSTI